MESEEIVVTRKARQIIDHCKHLIEANGRGKAEDLSDQEIIEIAVDMLNHDTQYGTANGGDPIKDIYRFASEDDEDEDE